MGYWCWEREDWGKWNVAHLKASDAYEATIRSVTTLKHIASRLSEEDSLTSEARFLEDESITTSLIEGKVLDRDSVRASIAKKLGIGPIPKLETRSVDGLIETLTDATQNHDQPLSHERLYRWQASIFPTGRDERGYPVETGRYRTSKEKMKIVTISGRKETVHYIAPPSDVMKSEMDTFIDWFNKTSNNPNLIRAAIASYWFVSIHPFEDGNGRLSRAIADMAIAQAEKTPFRIYSMSETLKANKAISDGYYENLEACSRGEKPIDAWVEFFLETLTESARRAEVILEDIAAKTAFWDRCQDITMNDRQRKFINWVLDKGRDLEGDIQRKRYQKIVGKLNETTAKRDLQDLVSKGVLAPTETKGRNAGYRLQNNNPTPRAARRHSWSSSDAEPFFR